MGWSVDSKQRLEWKMDSSSTEVTQTLVTAGCAGLQAPAAAAAVDNVLAAVACMP